jgi:hypothetical protein
LPVPYSLTNMSVRADEPSQAKTSAAPTRRTALEKMWVFMARPFRPEGYIGKYRKVGLNPDDQLWFTPGNLGYPVFDTAFGKLAMEICYDDTYWEIARTAAVKGAQIMCFMSSSDRALKREAGAWANHSTISAVQEINAWNGVALIATDRNNSESNPTTGLFTLNPVDAANPPVTASADREESLLVNFTTLADPRWWMSQQNLITGRRVDLLAPLTFPATSEVFKKWKSAPGFDISLWQQYRQDP